MELKNQTVTMNERLFLCFSVFIYSSLIVIIASFNGALGVPRNDDAFYIQTAFEFARTGRFVPVSSANMLIGQTILAYPLVSVFGESIAALQIVNLLFAAVGICALYLAMRIFLNRLCSVVSIIPLALGPIYGNLSFSFMSDVQAFTFQALSIFYFSKFISNNRKKQSELNISLIFAAVAFTIRQSSASVLFAIILTVLLLEKTTFKVRVLKKWISPMLAVIFCILIYVWRSNSDLFISSPTALDEIKSPISWALRAVTQFSATYAIYLLPLMILISPKLIYTKINYVGRFVVALSGVLTLAIFILLRPEPNGNYFDKFVPYIATAYGSADDLFSLNEWRFLKLISYFASTFFAMVVFAALWRLFEKRILRINVESVPAFFSICVLINLLMLNTLTYGGGLDRHGLLMVPLLAAVIGRFVVSNNVHKIRSVSALVVCFLIAAIGIRTISASTLFDGAKNEIAMLTVEKGVDAKSIDGGYEWFAFNQTDMVNPEVNIFDLWFASNSKTSISNSDNLRMIHRICYVTRLQNQSRNDKTVVTLDKEDIFGWKVHLEVQKLSFCP